MKRTRSETTGTPQGAFTRSDGEFEYQRLQEAILRKTGIACTVMVRAGKVMIQTESHADYYLAKSAIKGSTSGEIIRSI